MMSHEKSIFDIENNQGFGTLICYSLFFAAFFQIVCIANLWLCPDKNHNNKDNGDVSEDDSDGSTITAQRRPNSHHRARKQDKKKRR